jgi:malonate transporter MadL subunit
MVIYGPALLAACLLVGQIAGRLLGMLLGIDANVGGVGIAMLLLILVTARLERAGRLSEPTRGGILFWSAVYVPVVVAMAASLDVRGALSRGIVAILAGLAAAGLGFALVPLLCRAVSAPEVPLPGPSADAGGPGR